MSQPQAPARRLRFAYERYVSIAAVVVLLIVATVAAPYWLPRLKQWVTPSPAAEDQHEQSAPPDDHANAVALSSQAQASIGIQLAKVQLTNFDRAISVPGIVVERPGRSRFEIGTPLAAEVSRIFVGQAEAVRPGQDLFELQLTHDELVQLQASLLQTAEELDIVNREIARLEQVSREGAIAGRTVLERKYEQQKLDATLRVRRQAMLMHSFSQAQVDEILQTRRLLGTQTVRAPIEDDSGRAYDKDRVFQLQALNVERGQHVEEGARLAMLADHQELLIEGDAFERDAGLISAAWQANASVTAVLEQGGKSIEVKDLSISHLANALDPATRILHFYVKLPNALIRDSLSGEQRFVQWKYKPGQRMTLRVPVETLEDRIVLPAEAVAQDGVENYVFVFRDKEFHRQAVQVEHRDPLYAVLANDGSVKPGKYVATRGAQQILLALKNQSGGGVDPHAGHTH